MTSFITTKEAVNCLYDELTSHKKSVNVSEKNQYLNSINTIIEKLRFLIIKKREIIDELNLIYFEDEDKFKRGINNWYLTIDSVYDRLILFYKDDTLTPNLTENARLFWWKASRLRIKMSDPHDSYILSHREYALIFAWLLQDLRKNIIDRVRQLTNDDDDRNIKAKKSNKILSNDQTQFKEIALLMIDKLLKAEKKAMHPHSNFKSSIRCAAFCELLYIKGYFKKSKANRKQMEQFALNRYGLNISNSLQSSKKEDRLKHQNKRINNLTPLSHCIPDT